MYESLFTPTTPKSMIDSLLSVYFGHETLLIGRLRKGGYSGAQIAMRRLAYIDWLRNVSNLARACIHASVPYMASAAQMWPLNEEGPYLFDFGVFETHLFVMEVFDVI